MKSILALILCSLALSAATLSKGSYPAFKNPIPMKAKVVILGTSWCHFCVATEEAVKNLPASLDTKVSFQAIDIEVHEGASTEFNVRGTPTILFYDAKNNLVTKRMGGMNEVGLLKKLKEMGIEP